MAGSITVNAATPPPPGQPINAGISGSWFDPQQSGHGFLLQVVPGNVILAYWFVYTPDGTGAIVAGRRRQLRSDQQHGHPRSLPGFGREIPAELQSRPTSNRPTGARSRFTFTDCSNGTVSWNSKIPAYGTGTLPITKIAGVGNLTCN